MNRAVEAGSEARLVRVGELRVEGRRTVASCGIEEVPLAGIPDLRLADAATLGLRRLHHVVIDLDAGTGPACVVAGSTRAPARRRLPLGAALGLAQRGVPTYVRLQRGA